MKRFSLFLFIIIKISLHSIDLNLDTSAFSNAYGSMGFLQNHPSSVSFNPSFFQTGLETSATALFSLKDLEYYNLFIGKNIQKINITAGLSSLNSDLYKENKMKIAISRRLFGINLGVATNIILLKIDDFNVCYSLDFGLNKRFKKFAMAFAFQNFTNSKYQNEHLPVNLIYEANLKVNKNASVSFGLEKQIGYDFIFMFGSIYKINDYLSLFSGYRLNPNRIGVGFDIKIKKIKFSYSILTHSDLPLTHYITLVYAL